MRFFRISRLFQIQTGAKCSTRAAQDQDALLLISGRGFDFGGQLGQQFNRERVAALWTIQRENRDLRSLFFDENDWHRSEVRGQKARSEMLI